MTTKSGLDLVATRFPGAPAIDRASLAGGVEVSAGSDGSLSLVSEMTGLVRADDDAGKAATPVRR